MRKSIQYRVDVYVNEDGVVDEAQCECGAGQGPLAHCKHIGTVLYAAHSFHKDGFSLFSEITCIQVLAYLPNILCARYCLKHRIGYVIVAW